MRKTLFFCLIESITHLKFHLIQLQINFQMKKVQSVSILSLYGKLIANFKSKIYNVPMYSKRPLFNPS